MTYLFIGMMIGLVVGVLLGAFGASCYYEKDFACLDFVRGLDRDAVEAHVSAAAGIGSQAARLIKTHSPEVFVYSDGFVHG